MERLFTLMEGFMKLRWFVVAGLMLCLPSVVCARWIEDKVTMPSEATGPIEFSHYNHLENKAVGKNCTACHNDVFNIEPAKNPAFTMADMEKGKACGACHNGKKAFAVKDKAKCTACHPTHEIVFEVPDAGNVKFNHDVHTGMFGCGECHPALFVPKHGKNPKATMANMEQGNSCGTCHDGSAAFTVKENCDTCHQM